MIPKLSSIINLNNTHNKIFPYLLVIGIISTIVTNEIQTHFFQTRKYPHIRIV